MRELGIEDVQRHNHTLAWDGARHLAERWGTEPVERGVQRAGFDFQQVF